MSENSPTDSSNKKRKLDNLNINPSHLDLHDLNELENKETCLKKYILLMDPSKLAGLVVEAYVQLIN